jgi:glycosyltransferase involved in cell wall biosynthesis
MDAHYFYPRRHFGPMPVRMHAAVWYNGRNLRRLLQHTQLLMSQTVDAERRLAQTYDFGGRTAIIPNAVSALPVDTAGEPTLPGPLAPHTNRTKLLCLTQYYGHKNLEGIVTVFERFRDELDDVVVILNIGDLSNPYARKFLASIDRAGLGDRIVNVGFIPQASLADYYRSCEALLMPTFLESFSGTYVEAMRYELPILTSDLDFAHAVCGDAALYFDPWDPRAIKDAILRFGAEPQLGTELAAWGRARLTTLFRSWDDNARDLITELTKLVA